MAAPTPHSAAEEALTTAEANEPWWLDDALSVWRVEDGSLDLFLVDGDGAPGRAQRHHVLRVEAGEAAFACASELGRGPRLLAVGCVGTRVRRSERATLPAADCAELVTRWVERLTAAALEERVPPPTELLQAGDEPTVPAAVAVGVDGPLVWLEHLDGSSHYLGEATLAWGPGAGCLPLARGAWLSAPEALRVRAYRTEELVEDDRLWRSVAELEHRVLSARTATVAAAFASEQDRLTRRAAIDRRRWQQTLRNLAGLLEFTGEPVRTSEDTEDPLLGVCRLVGRACRLPVRPAPRSPTSAVPRVEDAVEAIARASGFRYRRVLLRGTWWREDNGPLLGFFADSADPVALLPARGGRYRLFASSAAGGEEVTPEVAARLVAHAYMFYPGFGEAHPGLWSLVKFMLRGRSHELVSAILLGAGSGLMGTLTPLGTGVLFDTILPRGSSSEVVFMGLALLGCGIGISSLQVARALALMRVDTNSSFVMTGAIWDRLLTLPVGFFRRYATGDLAGRALGAGAIEGLIATGTIDALLTGAFSIFSGGLLFLYSPLLGSLATGLVLGNLLLCLGAAYAELRYDRPLCEASGKLSGLVFQLLRSIAKLRVAGAENRAFARWADGFVSQQRLGLQSGLLRSLVATLNTIFPTLITVVIFAEVALRHHSDLTAGTFLAFSAAFSGFLGGTLALGSVAAVVVAVQPHWERLRPILDAQPEVDPTRGGAVTLRGEIEMSQVSFRYPTASAEALHEVSLRASPGEFVAIVGPSGAGKSTLLRLLLGFERPAEGSVYYDGQDLAGLDVVDLRRQIGVVLQSGRLLPGDILSNIVGAGAYTLEDAWAAARAAGLERDIQQMPMQMHTVIGEGASTLSGGQRQRILIARAVVAKPRILLFDEATSALDNRTQAMVTESLQGLRATRVVIAHRLSTIRHADRIYVLERGRVVQSGNYEALISVPGPFADLARRQQT